MPASPSPRTSRLPKASDVVAGALRQRILGGRLPPGTPIASEAELMESFDVGRGTVREALRLIEAEGLIRVRRGPRGGAAVVHPDPGQITRSLASFLSLAEAPLWQLTGFRNAVEPAAAAVAAKHATQGQRDALLDAASDVAAYSEAGPRFHELIAESTNHELFRVVLLTVYQLMVWHHVEDFAGDPEHERDMRRAHRRIADAISKGDEAAAERAMRQHVQAEERILAELGGLDRPIVPVSVWQPVPQFP